MFWLREPPSQAYRRMMRFRFQMLLLFLTLGGWPRRVHMCHHHVLYADPPLPRASPLAFPMGAGFRCTTTCRAAVVINLRLLPKFVLGSA
jgi:hypothetical protein